MPSLEGGEGAAARARGSRETRHRRLSHVLGWCRGGESNVTQVRQFLADGSAAVSDMTYLGNGNPRTVEGPVNLNGKRSLHTYEYDPALESHVAKITDNLGYASVEKLEVQPFGQWWALQAVDASIRHARTRGLA